MTRYCISCGKELPWHQVVGSDFCDDCLYRVKRRNYLTDDINIKYESVK